eukprot:7119598-Prymnesium_polylepis.1
MNLQATCTNSRCISAVVSLAAPAIATREIRCVVGGTRRRAGQRTQGLWPPAMRRTSSGSDLSSSEIFAAPTSYVVRRALRTCSTWWRKREPLTPQSPSHRSTWRPSTQPATRSSGK